MSIRQAAMSLCETVEASDSLGRVLAAATVGCPPAVPIVACGERIDETALRCFSYYGIDHCTVVIE
jgi:arginine/lysine/ornithine decarboxylase